MAKRSKSTPPPPKRAEPAKDAGGSGTWTKGSASAAHLQGLHSRGEALAAEGMARGRRRK